MLAVGVAAVLPSDDDGLLRLRKDKLRRIGNIVVDLYCTSEASTKIMEDKQERATCPLLAIAIQVQGGIFRKHYFLFFSRY